MAPKLTSSPSGVRRQRGHIAESSPIRTRGGGFEAAPRPMFKLAPVMPFDPATTDVVMAKVGETQGRYKSFLWQGTPCEYQNNQPEVLAHVSYVEFSGYLAHEYGEYWYRLNQTYKSLGRRLCENAGGSEQQGFRFSLRDEAGVELVALLMYVGVHFDRGATTTTGERVMSWSRTPVPATVFEQTHSIVLAGGQWPPKLKVHVRD